MAWTKLEGETSTGVTGILYTHGLRVSRDRIARLSDLLFGDDARRDRTGQRRFTPTQVEILLAGFTALDGGDIDLAMVERTVGERIGDPLTRFWAVVDDVVRRRQAAAEAAASRFAGVLALEKERMTA